MFGACRFSPVGVMFLVMAKMLEMQDFSIVAGQVGLYTLTVLLGLLLHGFVVLPLIYWLVMRQPPFRFLLDMLQAIATAFGTASRYGSLPCDASLATSMPVHLPDSCGFEMLLLIRLEIALYPA